jgi:Fic family protein
MTATAGDTMNAEQETDQSERMSVDEYGPFDNTEDTREIRGEQAATTTTSEALSTETDVAMEEVKPKQNEKQHKDPKLRTGSPPLPPQMMKQLHAIQRLIQRELRN